MTPEMQLFAIDQLRSGMKGVRQYKEGQEVISEGESGNSLYYILSGQVEVFKKSPNDPNASVPLGMLGPKDIFGEMSFLTANQVRSATVRAMSDCELIEYSADQLEEELSHLSPAMQQIIKTLMSRMTESNWIVMQTRTGGFNKVTHEFI